MAEFTYPLFRLGKQHDLIVMFTGRKMGEIIQQGTYPRPVGFKHNAWLEHEDSIWEPCADPRLSQRVNNILRHLKDN